MPGDTARILVKSPFNSAQALITYEKSGVMHQEARMLEGFAPEISVPITDRHIPNFYVSVVLVKGRVSTPKEWGEGRPRVKVGYITIPVAADSKALKVEITADKKTYAPGDDVSVTVKALDAAGKPVTGEMALMAVDQGSLMLTGFVTPNAFSTFYAEAGLGVTTTDSRIHLIGRRSYGVKGEPEGGGGGDDAQRLRSKFLAVAYWNPSVVTDANGVAKVTFKLPDNLTTFRIMAVAATADQFGSGEQEIITKKPFMLRANLPYFVGLGDKAKLSVVVHNYTDAALAGTITAKAEGSECSPQDEGASTSPSPRLPRQGGGEAAAPLRVPCTSGHSAGNYPIELTSDTEKKFKIAAQGKEEIFFDVNAKALGTAKLSFEAKADGVSDGLQLPLDIKLARPTEVFTSYGETSATGSELVDKLEEVYADVGGLDITLSSTALVGLTDAALYLVKYPYECTEQKISRAFGAMTYIAIAEAYDLKGEKLDAYKAKVQDVLGALADAQDWDGGLKLWSGMKPDIYLTAYGVVFMKKAQELGYDVDTEVFAKAKKRLHDILRLNAQQMVMGEDYARDMKAYILYALALSGEPEAGYTEQLYAVRDKLSPAARAQLAIAQKLSGGIPAQMDDFVRYANNHMVLTAAEAHFEMPLGLVYQGFTSSTYVDAYVLAALGKIAPDHPLLAKMARYLMGSAKKGFWTSTHTTAAVLTTLYDYLSTHEKDVPDFTAIVKLGDREVEKTEFKGRTGRVENASVPIKDLMALAKPTDLTFTKDGAGLLYYTTRLTYAPSMLPLPPREEGFTVFKSLLPFDGDKAATEFKRGDIVKVKLEFVLPATRRYIALQDGLPAGFEAVNFSLKTAQQHLAADLKSGFSIDHMEFYGDKIVIFADELPAGAYTFEYVAKAATKGSFALPPAQIEEMYHPEVFGRSMTGSVTIK